MIHIFIINSHAGKNKFSAGLRKHLADKYGDLQYYIFHTRKVGDEKDLMKEILNLFGGEKLRIYCCGGSGTISNAIYGVEKFDGIEFAFYPKGFTNDFLKAFGKEEERFRDIDELINGDVIKIDYIKTNHGNSLNTFSLGMDAVMVKKMEDFRDSSVLGKNIPYVFGFIYSVLFSKPDELEISLPGQKKIIGKSSEVFVGNGGVIGGNLWFDVTPDYTDGMAHTVIFKHVNSFNMVRLLLKLSHKKKVDEKWLKFDGHTDSITIKRRDNLPFAVDFDGELQPPQREWTVEIVRKGLSFVVPKGVGDEGYR